MWLMSLMITWPQRGARGLGEIGKVIAKVLEVLGIASLDSFFSIVIAFLVGVLVTVIPSVIVSALLVFIAIRVGPSIFGAFVKSKKFIPAISVVCIIVPTGLMFLSGGPLAAVGAL